VARWSRRRSGKGRNLPLFTGLATALPMTEANDADASVSSRRHPPPMMTPASRAWSRPRKRSFLISSSGTASYLAASLAAARTPCPARARESRRLDNKRPPHYEAVTGIQCHTEHVGLAFLPASGPGWLNYTGWTLENANGPFLPF
jgi:hypothetical protein